MTPPAIIDQGHGIYTVDTGFQRPGLAASHLIVEKGRAGFVDVGVAPTAAVLLDALRALDVAPEQVDLVMVTHVHLDHAGAAGVLMQALPNARLVVHPRGARHMIDPAKLIAGASAVYGEQGMRRHFGEIVPVSGERVVEAPDEFRLELNGRELRFLDTPGHARHHYCVYDARSEGFFVGDTFGLSYRELDTEAGAFVFPTTTPVQFDPPALHGSLDRLMSFRPRRMFLTHFGCVGEPERAACQLHAQVEKLVELAERHSDEPAGEARVRRMAAETAELVVEAARHHDRDIPRDRVLELMKMDIRLNAQGLECWLEARAET